MITFRLYEGNDSHLVSESHFNRMCENMGRMKGDRLFTIRGVGLLGSCLVTKSVREGSDGGTSNYQIIGTSGRVQITSSFEDKLMHHIMHEFSVDSIHRRD